MERFWVREGQWFKGNLHTHTTESDGAETPERIIECYERGGYDFLALTDHEKLTRITGAHSLLLIPGEEIAVGTPEAGGRFHIVALNVQQQIEKGQFEHPQEVIDAVRAQGGEAIIAHPYWTGLTIRDMEPLTGFLGIEAYNSTCEYSIGKGHSLAHWDALLARNRRVFGFAHDDAHYHFNEHRPNDAVNAYIMVKAASLSIEDIMAAIKAGEFYACSGPGQGPQILDFFVEDGFAVARTSPAKRITVVANPGGGLGERFTALQSPTVTEAYYKLRGRETSVRVEVVDSEGKTAWSNPIVL